MLTVIQVSAESVLNPKVVDYYGAAALDSITLAENKSSFRKCRLLPRVMRNVSAIEPQTTVFGVKSALPIYVSPASNALLGHPEGELNITRGVSPDYPLGFGVVILVTEARIGSEDRYRPGCLCCKLHITRRSARREGSNGRGDRKQDGDGIPSVLSNGSS